MQCYFSSTDWLAKNTQGISQVSGKCCNVKVRPDQIKKKNHWLKKFRTSQKKKKKKKKLWTEARLSTKI
jgi:hypothetical protein